jgi:hypothetical protein
LDVELSAAWRSVFESWPREMPRTGLIVLAGQEPITFVDFLMGDGFLIVERDRPDTTGARKVIIALSAIMAVKLTTTDALETLRPFTEGTPDVGTRAAAAVRRTEELSYRPPSGNAYLSGTSSLHRK